MDDSRQDNQLPEPGPPFEVGEHVMFAPMVFATLDDPAWFKWEEAVITRVDPHSESFSFRFVSEPEEGPLVGPHAQGIENIVRITPNYLAWRRAFEEAYARTGDDRAASNETAELWLRVLAEHPIHGHDLERVRRGRQQT
jgi:hypothetical protein